MNDRSVRACLRFGWTAVALFMLLGLGLEFLQLIKASFYLEVRLRRELWILAHTHGTLLGLVNVGFALTAERLLPDVEGRWLAARSLMAGSLLMPLGFLLGGLGNAEGDPSLFIVLVPLGALLAIFAVGNLALGAWTASQRPNAAHQPSKSKKKR